MPDSPRVLSSNSSKAKDHHNHAALEQIFRLQNELGRLKQEIGALQLERRSYKARCLHLLSVKHAAADLAKLFFAGEETSDETIEEAMGQLLEALNPPEDIKEKEEIKEYLAQAESEDGYPYVITPKVEEYTHPISFHEWEEIYLNKHPNKFTPTTD